MGTLLKKLLFIIEYSYALENKDVKKLGQMITKLAKKCKSASADYKKEIGEQCLKIFNLTNTQDETAVMIASVQGEAKMLKEWYTIPDLFVQSISPGPDKLSEYYEQSNYSYTTQDKEGRNALMLVCQYGNPDCIEYVLSPEVKEVLNQKDIHNQTPIEYAIKYNVYKKGYCTIDEFIRVFTHILNKKSKYFPNECFRLDERYVDIAYQMEEEDRQAILNAHKKTNAGNTKETSKKKYFAQTIIKSKASSLELEHTKNVILQDIDTNKVLTNNLQENSYKPGSSEYNNRILYEFKTFIDKVNTSRTDNATQTALLYECRELFCLPNNSFPEESIQFLHLVGDNNMRVEIIDTILGSSSNCNH